MAAGLPQGLDVFLPLLSTSDIKMKVTVGNELFTYLEEPTNSIECSDIGMFIDCIILHWLSNNNPKVSQYGIEIITQLINRMEINFRPYVSIILPLIFDRLGDNKEIIKVKAFFLIMKLMECDIISPQSLFDKISVNAFSHKNSSVKEGSMNLLLSTIEEFGVNCVTMSKIVPTILKLLSDPNVKVRHKAFDTLVDLYKHVGDKLRFDIQQKNLIPQSKMTDLMNKFDEAKAAGDLLQTAFVGLNVINNDETDRTCALAPRYTIGSIKRPCLFGPQNSTTLLQHGSVQKPIPSSSHAGAVDEDNFIRSFEDVPTIQILNARDLDDIMKKLQVSIQNSNEQWNKRVDSLKKIRSLVLIGAMKYEEFYNNLKHLEHSFQISVKDLRSQVVRETCITIAFLSQRLGIKFNHFAEFIFNNLIDLIPNSAKVIASSGLVAVRFILEHTHTPRIIPILANSMGSKSKDIRRVCCEFFDQILCTWPTQYLEKHITIIQNSIKKGIADADSNARILSRKAFWAFCEHFSEQGEILFNKLEPIYRKALLTDSGSNLCFPKSLIVEVKKSPSRCLNTPQNNISIRSSSAIDLQTAQRVKVRTEYAALDRQKVNPVISSQFVIKKNIEDIYQTDGARRSRGRVSFSQPTSRSGSPSLKFMFGQPKSPKGFSGIPRSQNTSRESSPNRFNFIGLHSSSREPLTSPTSKSIIAQNILMRSQEAESALAYALVHRSPKKIFRKSINYCSDESETSSISSEFPVDSHRQPSSSFYRNKSQHSLDKGIWNNSVLNIEDIISNCESSNWNNRKEGLIGLQTFLQKGNIINKILLKRLTNVFTKMFMDSQTKVISLFLDALNELIVTHGQYLEYWLYILLVKLFNKGGSDILSSVHSKILKTMEIVRLSFPCGSQLTAIFKFLTDPTQTPNVKMKIFAMNYIRKLAVNTDSGSAFSSVIDEKKDYATLALKKMIGWIIDNNIKQGTELRRTAQEAIQVLYNLNASQVTLRLSQLPEEYQEVVSRLIEIKIRRKSADQLQLMAQKYQNKQLPTSSLASPPLQPDSICQTLLSSEINKSLKQTTFEILKYNSECHYTEVKSMISHDSGISEMSVRNETYSDNYNDYKNDCTIENGIIKILDDLNKDTLKVYYKQTLLNHLKEIINDGSSDVLIANFKRIIKVILKLLFDDELVIREPTIVLITSLVQKPEIVPCFHSYTELIIMKVLNMCCDPCKSVVKVAEKCSLALSVCLQSQTVVRIITPLISVKEFPINLIAIKMMTELIDKHGSLPVAAQMKEIMPSLLQSYDNPDSSVRKAAVFCLVSLHKVFEEREFSLYISNLNNTKLKLLNLYIERARQHITQN